MINILYLFTSVDGILKDFNKKITKLNKLSDYHYSNAVEARSYAQKLTTKATVFENESNRAKAIAAKISALVS